jgi:HlyD family secretion protein
MKRFIIPAVIVIVSAFVVYNTVLKKEEAEFGTAQVLKGKISQEVFETGQVKKGDIINLSFKNTGTIEEIYVKVGEEVSRGEVLAKLETSQLQIQIKEAESALAVAQAQLDKVLAGATVEEIKKAKTAVQNKQIALDSAQEDLEAAYEDALNDLDDAYLKAYNAQNTTDEIRRSYFTNPDQAKIKYETNLDNLKLAASQIKELVDKAKENSQRDKIDLALSGTKSKLSDISNYLKNIREICEDPNYRNVVSSTDKTSIDTQRTNINTAISTVTSAQQTITSAYSSVESAEGDLQTAQDDLAILTAAPVQEDIDLYQAKVSQAQAEVDVLENKMDESYLRSPVAGQITSVKKKAGELAQPALQDIVATLLPAAPYEIEADIYEEDVVKINIGNPVNISLVPFPDKTFKGEVVSIDPAEKLVDGVVYYKITVAFDSVPENIKPGMTADLTIKTAEKENVLIVPEEAVQEKNGKTIAEVLKEEEIEEREIETGLKGSDDMVEIISGLQEHEKVILR